MTRDQARALRHAAAELSRDVAAAIEKHRKAVATAAGTEPVGVVYAAIRDFEAIDAVVLPLLAVWLDRPQPPGPLRDFTLAHDDWHVRHEHLGKRLDELSAS